MRILRTDKAVLPQLGRDLIAIGAYQRGNDAATDEALERWPEIMEFLGQDVAKAADLPHSQAALQRLVEQES